jgi:hypothetical protein
VYEVRCPPLGLTRLTRLLPALQDSKLPQVLSYSPFDAALSAAPGDLGPATHPLYYVLQGGSQLFHRHRGGG